MANNYSKYLRQVGIRTPYDEMTEAQINEANKANPLGSYGYQSAEDKMRQRQQQRAYEDAIQQERDAATQMMLMQSSPERAIGHYSGNAIFSGLSQILNKDKGQSVPQVPQNDPELDRYGQLVQEVGEASALEILGRETGNPAMITKAQELRQAEEARQLEVAEKKQGLKPYKVGEMIPVDVTDAQGRPAKATYRVTGYDESGMPKLELFKQGLKGQVNDTVEGFNGKGKSDTSNTVQDFETSMTATANALDTMDKMTALIDENPNIAGWSGRLIANVDNIMAGVKGLADEAGIYQGDGNWADTTKYDWGALEKTAQKSEKLKALVLELAAARAAATEPGGRFSEGDIQRQITQIGGNITNPRSFKGVLEQARETMVGNLENKGRIMTVNNQSVLNNPRYKAEVESLKKRVGMGTVVVTYPDGRTKRVPRNHPSLKNLPEGFKVEE